MTLISELSALVSSAFEQIGLDAEFGEVVVSQRPEIGQFQCNGALAGAKAAKRSPRDIAADIAGIISADPRLAGTEIAGPGFININLSDEYLAAHMNDLAAHQSFGVEPSENPHRYILDYGGPNVAKELHVGHLRTAIIGESVKRMLRFAGHQVTGDVHFGDWGVQMGQLLTEVAAEQPDLIYFDADYSGPYPEESPVTMEDLQRLYPLSSTKMKNDPEYLDAARAATVELQAGRPGYLALWRHFRSVSLTAIKAVYDSLDVSFDTWLGESSVHDRIAPMVERLKNTDIAVESDGAIVIHVTLPDEEHQIPPLMLVKSDGGFAYATTDLATVEERVDDLNGDALVYVVDTRQSLHFEQVFRAARLSGIAPESVILEHANNGTVNGPDGSPLKTRDGDLPLLRDLLADIEQIAISSMDVKGLASDYPQEERSEIANLVGMAAVKFGDLSNHRTSSYIFDLERFASFEGKTGPYLLYVAVRIGSVLRKAAAESLQVGPIAAASGDADRGLMLKLSEFSGAVDRAAAAYAPNHLAEYCYELAGVFNRFYEQCHILTESDPTRQASWLGLAALTRDVVVTSLGLLGIGVPERM